MKLFFDDSEFDYQVQRTIAKAAYGCADIGEVFAICARITPLDYDSWYAQWYAAGESNQQLAQREAARGNVFSATQAYLRASEYFRSAYFFTRRDIGGAPLQRAWRGQRETFRQAMDHLPVSAERVQIPYQDVHLEGYLYRSPGADPAAPAPTVLIPCGYDSTPEEIYSLGAVEAALRGFTCVTFSGPGQAEMLYEHGIGFRPDYEAVIGPVIDFALARPDVDAERIALIGRSFGGYLAPRAASKEPRLTAIAADPAQFDMGAAFVSLMPPPMLALFRANDPAFNDAIWQAYPGVHGQEYWLSRAATHGLSTPLEYAHEMQKYTVDVEAITCPTFVSYGEGDFAQVGTKAFYDRLTVTNKQFVMYRDADGGGGHCEGMGPSRYFADVFGWLRDALG